MAAKSPESVSLEPEGLTAEERGELVSDVTARIDAESDIYKTAKNWEAAKRFMPLLGMMRLPLFVELDEPRVDHLRKLIAFEYTALPQAKEKPRNTAGFLKEVRNEAGQEIARVRKYKGEVDDMTEPYRNAFEDWNKIKSSTSTDPLMIAMRQSVRNIRQQRSR